MGTNPRLLQMPKKRRGCPPGVSGESLAADAAPNTGRIESRKGKASATPAPRRKCRRDIGVRVAMKGAFTVFILGRSRKLVFERVVAELPLNSISLFV